MSKIAHPPHKREAVTPLLAAPPLAPVTTLQSARAQRAAALLRDEELPDQDEQAAVWGDSPRVAA